MIIIVLSVESLYYILYCVIWLDCYVLFM